MNNGLITEIKLEYTPETDKTVHKQNLVMLTRMLGKRPILLNGPNAEILDANSTAIFEIHEIDFSPIEAQQKTTTTSGFRQSQQSGCK